MWNITGIYQWDVVFLSEVEHNSLGRVQVNDIKLLKGQIHPKQNIQSASTHNPVDGKWGWSGVSHKNSVLLNICQVDGVLIICDNLIKDSESPEM